MVIHILNCSGYNFFSDLRKPLRPRCSRSTHFYREGFSNIQAKTFLLVKFIYISVFISFYKHRIWSKMNAGKRIGKHLHRIRSLVDKEFPMQLVLRWWSVVGC